MDINLAEQITSNFEDVLDEIIDLDNHNISVLVMNGGRASLKSSCASLGVVVGTMVDNLSAICLVKHQNKVKDRLVNQISETIKRLGLERFWKLRKSPLEYVLLDENGKETDVSIMFSGVDDPDNIKSLKPRSKYFRRIWLEELTNFNGLNEVTNIRNTLGRGGRCITIMTYNPPRQTNNWVNEEFNSPNGEVLSNDNNSYTEEFKSEFNGIEISTVQKIHYSTYEIVAKEHPEWLGYDFISMAEKMKTENKKNWDNIYGGIVTGTEANVFTNITDWDISLREQLNIIEVDRGLDASNGGGGDQYGSGSDKGDPWAYVEWYYDRKNKDIYLLGEKVLSARASYDDVAHDIRTMNKHNFEVCADGAVPMHIRMLRKSGLSIKSVKKSPGSKQLGIKWLQDLNHIYIDKIACPVTYREFTRYSYLVDKDDEDIITSEIPDGKDHTIDATRYAMVNHIKYDI